MTKKKLNSHVNVDVQLNLTAVLREVWPACTVVIFMLLILFSAVIFAGKVLYPEPMHLWLFNLSWILVLLLAFIFTALLGILTYLKYKSQK